MVSNWSELTNMKALCSLFWNSGFSDLTTIPLFHHMTLLRQFATYYGIVPVTTWGVTDGNLFPNMEAILFSFPVAGQSPQGNWSNISPTVKYIALGGAVGGNTQADTENIAVALANRLTSGAAPAGVIKYIQFVNNGGYTVNAAAAKTVLQGKGYFVTP